MNIKKEFSEEIKKNSKTSRKKYIYIKIRK